MLLLLVFGLNLQELKAQCSDVSTDFTVSQTNFCGTGPYTVNLVNTSTGPSANAVTYEWVLDGTTFDNTTGLVAPDDFIISAVGTYNVELIATDTIPCTDTASVIITIYPDPVADFDFNPDNECALTPINFSNLSTGTFAGTDYSWDFGDGNTSTDQNPTHTYSQGGSFTITLTVSNAAGCTDTYSETITVLDIPDIFIFGDDGDGNTTNCLLPGDPTTSQTVDFFNTTTGAVSYFWDFGDGNTSTDPEPSHLYTSYGTFDAVMTATGANGCTVSDTIEVVFERFVSASLSLDATEYSGCTPMELTTLVNNSNNANNYVWDFGDGSAPYITNNITPPNHVYTDAGTYTISLTASNNCNSANATISPIIIVDKPEVDFDFTSTNGACAPADISFTNNSVGASPANAFDWDMGNGNTYTTTVTPPDQYYDTAGVYTVSLSASNACGDSTLTQNIILDTIPVADISVAPIDQCSPATFTFDNFSSGNINQYAWYLDGALQSNDSIINPLTFTYPAGNTPINHEIVLAVSNQCGIDYDTVNITVHRPTLAQFNASATQVCLGNTVTFTNQSLGENLTYEWDFGNGTTETTAGPHSITYVTAGTYTVQLIADGYCGPDTVEQIIEVLPITVAAIDPLDPIEGCSPVTVSFESNSSGANLNYTWTVDGNFAANTPNLGPITFNDPPSNNVVNHIIELTVAGTCGTETAQTTVIVHPPTEASITANPLEVCLGEEILVTNQSLGEDLTYEWDFGDGTTSTLEGPHTLNYANDGTYEIQLIADGYCGPDTVSTSVTVNPFPVADFSPDLPDGCEVLEMTFTNNSTPTANQDWNFGPNATPTNSTDFNPGIVSFPDPGIEMIVLTIEENGCVSSDTNYIEVLPLPIVDFVVTPDEGCSDLDVVINNNSQDTGVEDFDWDFGNGNTFNGYNAPNQTYTAVQNDSIYEVQLVVTSGVGCADSLSQIVTVYPVPEADFDFIADTICLNNELEVDNLSTPGVNYAWDFGDGNSATTFNPTHQYTSAGTYSVSLIATSGFNCADTIVKEIEVQPIPDAQFTNSTECLGFETVFTDNSTGTLIDWSWDFGDGTTSTTQNPNYEYATAGNFNVQLTVENDFNCFDSISQNVLVNEVPTADFDATDFCLGDQTSFTDLTVGVTTSYEWDFDDGTTSTDQNPTHTFVAVGDYDVQLIAFGGSGCADTIVQTITITGVPTADFSFQTACTNDTTFFTDLSAGNPDVYEWDFDDGTTDLSNNPNPDHIYNNPGTYDVTLTVAFSTSGCSNTITYPVDAHPRTEPAFTANTPCLGSSTSFVDETTNTPILWEWDFNDGSPLETTQNPNHEYANPGLYEVQLITENVFGCSDTLLQTVEVFELPTPDFSFDTVCLNAITTFQDASIDAVAWEYDFDDGTISNSANPTHTYTSDGSYNVMQVVTNAEGCTDTLIQEVLVYPNPTADWEADTACFSYLTSFTDNSVDAVNWEWDLGEPGVNSNQQNPSHIYSADANFTVALIVENVFGCTDTLINDVLVLPQPEASFTNTVVCAESNVDFTNTSQGNPIAFEWDFDDGSPIATDENPSHTYLNGGFYDITFIAENAAGCADTIVENIEVYTVPIADFEADTVCLFDITSFTDLTQDATPLASWDWDFDDGNTSFQQDPTYIYQNPGIYDVTLITTNINGCSDTVNHDVLVSIVPEADFTVTTDCFGAPTFFDDLSTNNPGIWLWNFGDGTIVNGGPNEQHTYANPGNYVVTLDVLGSDSICSDQAIQVITISQEAQADFFIPNQICATEDFNFVDNSSSNLGAITDYEWNMGDGTVYTTQNGTHAYATDGIYTVTLNITTADGCESTYSETIEVFPITEASFDWTLACQGETILFTNTSIGNTTDWFWNFDDGNVSAQQFPEHTYANAGTYEVMLIVQNLAGCADTSIQTVIVHPTPQPDFTTDEVCYGTQTTFTDQSTIANGTIDTYEWDFGNGEGSATIQNPTHTFDAYSELHETTLTLTSDQGCINEVTLPVSLLPIVDFDINIDGGLSGCAPVEVVFDNQSVTSGNADIISYSWDFDDSTTSFNQSPVHIFDEPGTYNVVLTVTTSTDCQLDNSGDLVIDVFPSPIAGFDVSPTITLISEPNVTITDESYGATAWEYDFSDGFYSNESSLSYSFDEPGLYEIIQYVQNEFGCVDTAMNAVRINEDFTFFAPNSFTPNNDGRNDVFQWIVDGHERFSIIIFNRWGEVVFESNNANSFWDGSYAGQIVKDGVYVWKAKILDLKDEEHVITGHVTVLR